MDAFAREVSVINVLHLLSTGVFPNRKDLAPREEMFLLSLLTGVLFKRSLLKTSDFFPFYSKTFS